MSGAIAKETHLALLKFWKQVGIPVFESGRIPESQSYPYITFNVSISDTFETDLMTAFIWCRSESGVNVYQQRADLMDKAAKILPHEGVMLGLSDGFIVLRRSDIGFMSYYDDDDDPNVFGCRIAYEATFYTL